MIRDEDGVTHPGSFIPTHPLQYLKVSSVYPLPPEALSYFELEVWKNGGGFLITGSSGSGKTTMGLALVRTFHHEAPELESNYWSEADYFQDQRELWSRKDMAQRMTFDDTIWRDHLDWERQFLDLKESPILFVDNVGMGYTPSHTYELSNLLRSREDRGLVTIVGSTSTAWSSLPRATRALFERHTVTIDMPLQASA